MYKILLESVKTMRKDLLKTLIENCGQKYSEILGIKLQSANDAEVFKWFLASVLFGAPITENAAIKTYRCFEKHRVLTPQRILKTGWKGLVKILDEGSYTRYDFKTADKLLEIAKNLTEEYGGSITSLYMDASDEFDLEKRIKSLSKGIGDVTVSIFLRELRNIWEKADPNLTALEILGARKLRILKNENKENALEKLKQFWSKNSVEGKSFVNFETSLLRIGKSMRRNRKCATCPVKGDCLTRTVP
jgi:endonuclease III